MEENKRNAWLSLAKQAYDQSTTYLDNNFRKQWAVNYAHFHSKHRAGSKYYQDSYKYRSKLFRPKSRAIVRANEASASAAFFTTNDAVWVDPINQNDPMQVASAELNKELLNYRLQHSINWFLILLGAYQDAQVPGVVTSYQYWDHLADKPVINLFPVENLRISPAANWVDPINTSPYLIHLLPMYVYEVEAMMEEGDPESTQRWKKLTRDELLSATSQTDDITRLSRQKNREEIYKNENKTKLKDYDIVWVHRNFLRQGGNDYVFHGAGNEFMLSEPVPIEEMYFHGERPITMGFSVIEAHRIYPESPLGLGENLQVEINEVANSRQDNVKLILNKRYLVARGGQVSLKTLMRNAAGSVTLVNNVDRDVKPLEYNDVTSSGYAEQDRLNLDFDELLGSFSQSSVQSNRKLNETVGGMNLMKSDSNVMQEYQLKVFTKSWAEKTLNQVLKLEQAYETDTTILAIAAQKAKLFQRYGVSQITDQLLNQGLTAQVSLGLGASNPLVKLERFLIALQKYAEFVQTAPPDANLSQIRKEIFGRLGYEDGGQFFQGEEDVNKLNQIIQKLQQEMEQMAKDLGDKQSEQQVKVAIQKMKEEGENYRQDKEIDAEVYIEAMKLKEARENGRREETTH